MLIKRNEELGLKAYNLSKNETKADVLRKYEAVYFYDIFKIPINEIAKLLNRTTRTVTRYRTSFKKEENLSKKSKRCRSYLTYDQEKQFISSFIEKAKRGEIINLKQIHQVYEKVFNRKVAESTVYRLMERHDWRKIVPRSYHPKKNKEKTETFKGDLKKSTD